MPNTTIEPNLTQVESQVSAGSILLAEDSAIYQHLIKSHFADWGFDFVCAKDGREAWRLLTQPDAPRLALLDWVLPEVDGVEICRRLRGRGNDPYTYTILLTGKSRKQEMLEALDAGADDFLAKPFDPLELKARLLVGKRIVNLQEKLVSANSALQFVASHDFLTGVWNRGEIVAFLQRELARSERDAEPVGVVLLDVDHFKRVNDEFGHQVGDIVLKEVAKRISLSGREYDGVGRYGGEEFLLVIPGCDLETTYRKADRLRALIAAVPIVTPEGSISISASMGVAVADTSAEAASVLSRADIALYEAKRNGRNRVERYLGLTPVS